MDPATLLLLGVIAVVPVIVALDRYLARARADGRDESRGEALHAVVAPLGLTFEPTPADALFADWARSTIFNLGDQGVCLNAVSGMYDGVPVLVFDRRWRVVSHRSASRRTGEEIKYYYAQAFAARLDVEAPSLMITSRQAALAPKEASGQGSFLTTAARDLLATRDGWHLECSGRVLLLYTLGRLPPREVAALLNFGVEFLAALKGEAEEV